MAKIKTIDELDAAGKRELAWMRQKRKIAIGWNALFCDGIGVRLR